MARGFLSGVVWGGVVCVLGAGIASLVAEGPNRPNAVVLAPQSVPAPGADEGALADAVTDADLVRDGEARQQASPQVDDISAAVATGSDTALVPETGAAEDLGVPVQSADVGRVTVEDLDPVLPSPQGALPSAPDAEAELSISIDPAQPAMPVMPEVTGAFDGPAELDVAPTFSPTLSSETMARSDTPAVAGVAAPARAPGAPSAPPAMQNDVISATPSARVPKPSVDEGPSLDQRPSVRILRPPEPTVAVIPEVEPDADAIVDLPAIQAFAAPVGDAGSKPLMAIVLMDNGVDLTSGPAGLAALRNFPYPLSFAVDSAMPEAAKRMAEYRAQGFEVLALLDVPKGATARDAERAVSQSLDAVPQAVALMEAPKTGLQDAPEVSDQIIAAIKASGHGLVLQSSGLNTVQKRAARDGVPAGLIFRDFDSAGQTPRVIRRFLDQAAFRARQDGGVIMVGRVRPDTISALLLWGLQDRASRVALVPISAVLTRVPAQ